MGSGGRVAGVTAALGISFAISPLGASTPLAPPPAQTLQSALCYPAANLWQRAARLRTQVLCDLLDQARANLFARPARTLELAERVLIEAPGQREALLLAAHAQWELGEPGRAYAGFLAAERRREASLGVAQIPSTPPVHLWAQARSAVLVGEYQKASVWYRELLLVLEQLPSSAARTVVLVEAAMASLYTGTKWAEARGYLRRAREEDAPLWSKLVVGMEGLVSSLEGSATARGSVEGPSIYAQLVWFFEREVTAAKRPQAPELHLPRSGDELILAHLAAVWDERRLSGHLQSLKCGAHVPGHLVERFASKWEDVTCPAAEWDDRDGEGAGADDGAEVQGTPASAEEEP